MTLQNFIDIYHNSSKRSIVVYLVLRILTIFCLVRELILKNYNNAFLCVVTLVLFAIPFFVKDTLAISLPSGLEIIIFCFIFAADILGEINNFYGQFRLWDTMLHTLNGFLAASVGFSLVDLLNTRVRNFQLAPVFVAIVAFCFSMTVGVTWEFMEFSADAFFKTDAQKDRIVRDIYSIELNPNRANTPVAVRGIDHTVLYDADGNVLMTVEGGYLDIGLIDTMKDLIVNMIGAVVFSVFGYLYIADRDRYKLAHSFQIERLKKPGGAGEDPAG